MASAVCAVHFCYRKSPSDKVAAGVLPSGKDRSLAETPHVTGGLPGDAFFRRVGRASSTSAKMADAAIFRHALPNEEPEFVIAIISK
jgi:hypothetical protein